MSELQDTFDPSRVHKPDESLGVIELEDDDADEQGRPMCPSVSPHGNKCDFVTGHKGRHEIHHMMGKEDWDDDGNSRYGPSRITRKRRKGAGYARCCGKDEMRTEIERLNVLVTKGRTLNDLERLMEENERLRAENAELRGIIRGEREIAEGKTVTYEV